MEVAEMRSQHPTNDKAKLAATVLAREFNAEWRPGVMPVQNYSRRFKEAPGSHFTGTARVIACRQVSRVSSEVSHKPIPFIGAANVEQHRRSLEWTGEKAFPRPEKSFPRKT